MHSSRSTSRGRVLAVFATIVLGIPCAQAQTASPGFETWKTSFVSKWGRREVPARFMRDQLRAITYDPKVIAIDRDQVTSSTTMDYRGLMSQWLSSDPPRIARGKQLLKEHADVLEKIERRYGVDKEAIVALWGVETLYGSSKGSYNVIQSLATLAFDGRRKRFFETQLFTALKILHRGHVKPEQFLGSWSGALGHCQFMPSSFEMIAVDFDGDGRKDIWNSIPDVFASIANYLRKAKWQKGMSVGELAFATTAEEFDPERARTPAQFNRLGLRTAQGQELSGNWTRKAAKIPLQGSPYVLRGSNYMSVLRWNNSSLFAAFTITLMEAFKEP